MSISVKSGRLAGALFLYVLIVSVINGLLVMGTLSRPGQPLETAKRILAQEWLFRLGILCELSTALAGVVLGLLLYGMVRHAYKMPARAALCLKLLSSALVMVIALMSLMALLAAQADTDTAMKLMLGAWYEAHTAIYAVPMLLLGISFTLFFTLLLHSGYLPKWLCGFAALSYVLIFVHAGLALVSAHNDTALLQAIFWSPSVIAELLVGVWLIAKGSHGPAYAGRLQCA